MREPVLGWVVLGLLVLRQLLELALAHRNTAALVRRGGVVHRGDATLRLVALHALTGTGIVVERLLGARVGGAASWAGALLGVVALLGRAWTLRTLGRRWTIRVVTLRGEVPVRRGPYRFLRHPNYVVLVLEVVAWPLFFHAWWTLGVLLVPHLLALRARVRCEELAWDGALS